MLPIPSLRVVSRVSQSEQKGPVDLFERRTKQSKWSRKKRRNVAMALECQSSAGLLRSRSQSRENNAFVMKNWNNKIAMTSSPLYTTLMKREPAVYIVTNKRNGTLYVGVTSDIGRRAFEHRKKLVNGFSKRYGCSKLVWYEFFDLMTDAIEHEKKIKGASRNAKLRLIEDLNPEWKDLFETLQN